MMTEIQACVLHQAEHRFYVVTLGFSKIQQIAKSLGLVYECENSLSLPDMRAINTEARKILRAPQESR